MPFPPSNSMHWQVKDHKRNIYALYRVEVLKEKSVYASYLLIPVGSHGYDDQYHRLNGGSTKNHPTPDALVYPQQRSEKQTSISNKELTISWLHRREKRDLMKWPLEIFKSILLWALLAKYSRLEIFNPYYLKKSFFDRWNKFNWRQLTHLNTQLEDPSY